MALRVTDHSNAGVKSANQRSISAAKSIGWISDPMRLPTMQKLLRRVTELAAFLGAAFYISPFSTCAQPVSPRPKMAAEIAPKITTPNSVETSPEALRLFDGLPDQETFGKVCDNLKALQ